MSPPRYTRAISVSYLFDDGPAGGPVPRGPPPLFVQPEAPVRQHLGRRAALAGHQPARRVHVRVPGVEVAPAVGGGDQDARPDAAALVRGADDVAALPVGEHGLGADLPGPRVLDGAEPAALVVYGGPAPAFGLGCFEAELLHVLHVL